jgi:eukaryotic-like serine/threonine-protein kinase
MTLLANRYQTGAYLASIKHSEFYEGIDIQQESPVIIRLIDIDQHEGIFTTKLQYFMENEMRLMKMLNHPNILAVLDFGMEGNTYYQINEFVPFKTLRSAFTPSMPLPNEEALRLCLEVADILAHLHRIGLVHCDLKPDNILITDDRIKIMEFSIANHVIGEGMVTGTPSYMSPESVQGEPPAPIRDIWAPGIVLYEMLSGLTPFRLDDSGKEPSAERMRELITKIVLEPVPSLADAAPDVPPRVVRLIERLL